MVQLAEATAVWWDERRRHHAISRLPGGWRLLGGRVLTNERLLANLWEVLEEFSYPVYLSSQSIAPFQRYSLKRFRSSLPTRPTIYDTSRHTAHVVGRRRKEWNAIKRFDTNWSNKYYSIRQMAPHNTVVDWLSQQVPAAGHPRRLQSWLVVVSQTVTHLLAARSTGTRQDVVSPITDNILHAAWFIHRDNST